MREPTIFRVQRHFRKKRKLGLCRYGGCYNLALPGMTKCEIHSAGGHHVLSRDDPDREKLEYKISWNELGGSENHTSLHQTRQWIYQNLLIKTGLFTKKDLVKIDRQMLEKIKEDKNKIIIINDFQLKLWS